MFGAFAGKGPKQCNHSWKRAQMTCASGKERVCPRDAWPIAFAASGIALIGSFLLIPAFFPTNDDPYIQQILSGGISREPSPYIMFVNFALCWLISRLFLIVPGVPWWVVAHLLLLFLAIALIDRTIVVLSRRHLSRSAHPIWVVFLILAVVNLGLFSVLVARMQFTTTSTMLLVAAIFSTCCWRPEDDEAAGGVGGRCILPALLAVFGSAIRSQSGLIGFLFWGVAVSAVVAARDGSLKKRLAVTKLLIATFLIAAVVSVGLVGIHELAYSSPEWSANRETSRQLSRYTDYARTPYEQNREVYDSVGWDEDLVELTGDWFHMDERVNADALRTINDANEAWLDNLLSDPMGTLLTRLGEFGQPVPLAYTALLLVVGLLALSRASSRAEAIITWMIAAACVGLLIYLVVKGRLPERAAYSVIFPATAALAAISARGDAPRPLSRRSVIFGAIVCVSLMVALSIPTGGMGKLAALLVVVVAVALLLKAVCADALSCAKMSMAVRVLVLAAMLFPGVAAVRQYGWWSDNYALMSQRQDNIEVFYDYVNEHDDLFFFYATDAGLTPQSVWQSRWPKNQTAWGGWRYCYTWFKDVMSDAGFEGLPTGRDLLDPHVRFVCSSDETLELILSYLQGLYGDVEAKLDTTLGSGINIYRLNLVG